MTYEEAFKNLSVYAIRAFVGNAMTSEYVRDLEDRAETRSTGKAITYARAEEHESYHLLDFIAKMSAQIDDPMTVGTGCPVVIAGPKEADDE